MDVMVGFMGEAALVTVLLVLAPENAVAVEDEAGNALADPGNAAFDGTVFVDGLGCPAVDELGYPLGYPPVNALGYALVASDVLGYADVAPDDAGYPPYPCCCCSAKVALLFAGAEELRA